jgi:lipopolysaccharide export system permease protein
MQIQRHASGAFSTLALALLAIPLALKTGRSETFLNLGLALALALLYYLLWTLLGLLDHHPSLHPELLLWLPNLLYETLALALLLKAARR